MGNHFKPFRFLSEILKCFIQNLFAMPKIKEAFGNGTVGPPGFLAGVDGQDLSNG